MTSQGIFYGTIFFLGASIGSFVYAWVGRRHHGRSIMKGRSLCPCCRHAIRWYDNIPVFSFFWLRGKCRDCRSVIPWQCLAAEVMAGVLFVLVYFWHAGAEVMMTAPLIRDWFIVTVLLFIFWYDLQYREIGDSTTLIPGLVLVLLALVFGWHSWQSLVLGIVVGVGFFLVQYIVSHGRWIGGGDIRFGFLMGVVLGWPRILVALFFAYIVGALFNVVALTRKTQSLHSAVPFGPYLVIGTIIAMGYADAVVRWYLSLLSW